MAARLFLLLALLLAPAGLAHAAQPPSEWPDLFPGATRLGPIEGEPPAAAAYRDGELLGYVFSTRMVVNSRGYSGKPLDVLLGLDLEGRIVGARLLEHHEPILIVGVRPGELERFVRDHVGLRVDRPVRVVRGTPGEGEIAAVAGATVSSLVIDNTIVVAARAVAQSRGILASGGIDVGGFEPATWEELVQDGSIVVRRFSSGEVDERLSRLGGHLFPPGEPEDLFLEVAVALATPARIGRNLLGDRLYDHVMAELRPGDQLLFVAARGRWSIKGTAWRRTGAFDRLRLVQGEREFLLHADRHRRLDRLAAQGAPEWRELALFDLPRGSGFDPARPFRLQVRVDGVGPGGETVSTFLEVPYELAARYRQPAETEAAGSGLPDWREIWWERRFEVGTLVLALFVLTLVLFDQDTVARNRPWHRRIRLGFMVYTLLVLGWWAGAQLSVVNVLTFAHALMTGFDWNFFLLEPLIFVLWSYVAVALVFWGRGVYCGWLCPFGALQELVGEAAGRLGVPRPQLPFPLHEGLRTVKFVAFLAIFAVSLGDMTAALRLAEVEPFKTAVVLRFAREWPFVAYALALLALAAVIPRAFCRYLCPLGAALALPARLRQFEWLKRRFQCGRECRICEQRCPVGAIHPEGFIHPGECIHCLECQVNYRDDTLCPPLVRRRQRREAQERLRAGAGATAEEEAAS